ncbi:MAG: hypothetical protein AB8G96_07665 [Phycisphaerales bacterium]
MDGQRSQLGLKAMVVLGTAALAAGCAMTNPVLARTSAPPPPPGGDPGAPGVLGDQPVLFVWQTPEGAAVDDDRIIEFVRIRCHHEPELVADYAINTILSRGLQPGQVAILLQNFGMGAGDPNDWFDEGPALFGHWGDALAHRARSKSDPDIEVIADEDADSRWWDTPWMSHGIADSRAWMDRFIARYKQRQAANPAIPDPDRFHFDSEERVEAFRKWTSKTVKAMKQDPRWDTEPIPGFDGRTLAQLLSDGGNPTIDPNSEYYRPVNRDFARWYPVITNTANDAAMNEAAYEPIRAAWPNVLNSNYGSSARVVGGSPDHVLQSRRHSWLNFYWKSFGDQQAPVFYFPKEWEIDPGESLQEAAVRFGHDRMQLHVRSQADGPDITPWLMNPGMRTINRPGMTRVGPEYTRAQMEVMRQYGVDEMLMWGDDTVQQTQEGWNRLPAVLDGVFGPHLAGARLTAGESDDRNIDLLRRRWNDVSHMDSVPAGSQHELGVELDFESPLTPDQVGNHSLRLIIAQDPGAPVPEVRLNSGTGMGGPVQMQASSDVVAGTLVFTVDRGSRFVTPDGKIQANVRWRNGASFDVDVDLFMLTADLTSDPAAGGSAAPRGSLSATAPSRDSFIARPSIKRPKIIVRRGSEKKRK